MKIDVIQLRGRFVSAQCDGALEFAVEVARAAGHDVAWPKDIFASALLPHARNLSLKRVRPDADFILFVDDDMIPVRSAIVDLLKHDVDAVSALCTTRAMPVRIAGKVWDNDRIKSLDSVGSGLVGGPFALGFGFLLVRASALRGVQLAVRTGADWLCWNKRLLKRLGASIESAMEESSRIAKERCAIESREGWLPVFQLSVDGNGFPVGEDAWFSRLLHLAGFQTFIDAEVLVGHMGEFPYSPFHLGAKHPTDLRI